MTTPADATQVLAAISLVHRRTAPKPANAAEAEAMARTWARVFSRYDLELRDLLAAVERRAGEKPDAPEPAEIVTYARAIRRDRSDRENADREKRAEREEKIDRRVELREKLIELGNAKAVDRA